MELKFFCFGLFVSYKFTEYLLEVVCSCFTALTLSLERLLLGFVGS